MVVTLLLGAEKRIWKNVLMGSGRNLCFCLNLKVIHGNSLNYFFLNLDVTQHIQHDYITFCRDYTMDILSALRSNSAYYTFTSCIDTISCVCSI